MIKSSFIAVKKFLDKIRQKHIEKLLYLRQNTSTVLSNDWLQNIYLKTENINKYLLWQVVTLKYLFAPDYMEVVSINDPLGGNTQLY